MDCRTHTSGKRRRPTRNRIVTNGQDLISKLPDECIQTIFSFLPSSGDRYTCAAVSKRWLVLLAQMRGCQFKHTTTKPDEDGSCCLEANEANDTRVAAMAVGTYAGKLLSKLTLRGGLSSFAKPAGITDFGLQIVAHSFPNLKSLALWDCSKVSGAGLACIALCCLALERLDVSNSARIDDTSLVSVARNCSKLRALSLEECPLVSNNGLVELANRASCLEYVSIHKCPLVGDNGIVSIVSKLSRLTWLKLSNLNVSDRVLEAIGKQNAPIKVLRLENLEDVTMSGLAWVEATNQIELLSVRSCKGVNNFNIGSINGLTLDTRFKHLRHVDLKDCDNLSDSALDWLTKSTRGLKTIKLENSNRLTTAGVMVVLNNCRETLRILSLTKCTIGHNHNNYNKDLDNYPMLDSLILKHCNLGDTFLIKIAPACTKISHVALLGLTCITDSGIASLFSTSTASSGVRISLSGCIGITDWSMLALAMAFGRRLRSLSLERCMGVSDWSLDVIGEFCSELVELDVSRCGVTDEGVTRLATKAQKLEVLSLAGCDGVTDESLGVLEVMCCGLVGLNVKHCSGISSHFVKSFRDMLWWCDVLY